MKGILLTASECTPCQTLKAQFADLIERGEIVQKSLEDNSDEVLSLMQTYGVDIPSLLIISDSGELIMSMSSAE